MTQGKLPDHVQMLLSPPVYPHPVERVQLIQTHISYVLLAGDYVYKIKKPVDMGFLDYTTLEKRRFYCEEEVRLNSRLCSDAYLGVVAISTVDGKILLDAPSGTVLDYAVKMRRLPEERMMERLLAEHAVSSEMITRLTGRLAAFHRSSESSKHISTLRQPGDRRRQLAGELRPDGPLHRAHHLARAVGGDQGIRRRDSSRKTAGCSRSGSGEGRIRDCHGDLRTNAVCFEDGICIFDCIEFNERFRYCDVASDLAFLAMDMDFQRSSRARRRDGRPVPGAVLDTTLPLVLHFYKCYRAFVRGKVDGFQLDQAEVPPEQREAAAAAGQALLRAGPIIRRSFHLACRDRYGGRHRQRQELPCQRPRGSLGCAGHLLRRHAQEAGRARPQPAASRANRPWHLLASDDRLAPMTRCCDRRRLPPAAEAGDPRRLLPAAAAAPGGEGAGAGGGVPFLAVECVVDGELVRERLRQRRSAVWSPSDGRWEVYEAQLARAEPISELRDEQRLSLDGNVAACGTDRESRGAGRGLKGNLGTLGASLRGRTAVEGAIGLVQKLDDVGDLCALRGP